VRAEMTYHKLKEEEYNVQFLNTKAKINDKGEFMLENL
jgi:hypothetical protein